MKAFRFRLQRVLELRRTQQKQQEAKLEYLIRQREARQVRREELQRALAEAQAATGKQAYLHAVDLVALGNFQRRVDRECLDLSDRIEADNQLVQEQRTAVVQARRQVRLLEKLQEKRTVEWQVENDRELEALASEFSAAQWLRLQNESPRG